MTYLEEHRDAVMEVLRHSLDQILEKGAGWTTTFGTRSRADARKLWAMLEQAVFDFGAASEDPCRIELAVVHEVPAPDCGAQSPSDSPWGVCVSFAAPQPVA